VTDDMPPDGGRKVEAGAAGFLEKAHLACFFSSNDMPSEGGGREWKV